MSRKRDDEYRQMLSAMIDSKAVILSLLDGLGITPKNREQLRALVQQGALAIVRRRTPPLPPKPRRVHGKRRVQNRGKRLER